MANTSGDDESANGDMVAQLDPKVQKQLGTMLKQHYDDLVGAPIPDQFLVLLAELEAKELYGEKPSGKEPSGDR